MGTSTVDLAGVCTGPGPCVTSPLGTGKNWVTKVGGLPAYIRAIAHALERHGHTESQAIQLAIGTVQRWARGEGNVSAETRARAAKALVEWEAKRAAAHALTAAPAPSIDLATFTEAQHPRGSKGTPQGGRFVAKSGGTAGGQKVTRAQLLDFQRRHGLPATGRFDAATVAKLRTVQAAATAGGGSSAGGSSGGSSSAGHPTAKAQAKAQATASAVNRLSDVQRTAFKMRHPNPPSGFRWEGNQLVTADRARVDRRVRREATAGRTNTIPRSLARRIRRVLHRTKQDLRMAALAPASVLDLTTGPIAPVDLAFRFRHGWIPLAAALEGHTTRSPYRTHLTNAHTAVAAGRHTDALDHLAKAAKEAPTQADRLRVAEAIRAVRRRAHRSSSTKTSVNLSVPVDLASAGGHHIPGTAYHWRHNWRPRDVYTALKHRRPDLARALLRRGAPFHHDEPAGIPAPRRLNIPLTRRDRTEPPERIPQPPRAPSTPRKPKTAKPTAEDDAAVVAAARAEHGENYRAMREWPDEALDAQSREKESVGYRNWATGEVTQKMETTSRAKFARKLLRARRAATEVAARKTRKASDGDPVSKSIETRADVPKAVSAEIDRALAAIDKVHHDGQLTPIPVVKSAAKTRYGQYDPNRGGSISVTVDGDHKALTTTHEIGHWLDSTALGNPDGSFAGRDYASDKADTAAMQDLLRAIGNSPTWHHLGSDDYAELSRGDRSYARYLRTRKELWARAYAQYIALRSADSKMRQEVDEILSRRDEQGYRSQQGWAQWPWDEFEPIAAAIDTLLTERGWRQ